MLQKTLTGFFLVALVTAIASPVFCFDRQSNTDDPASPDFSRFRMAPAAEVEKLERMSPEALEALDRQLAEAQIRYYDGDYARALALFESISERVETLEILFWTGMSAKQLGRYALAEDKFTKMLAIDPSLHRARLELAATLIAAGKYEEAREPLTTVRSASPPPEVAKNIDRLLLLIDSRTRRVSFGARVSAGAAWDSNVSSGPDQREIAVLGGTLTLDELSSEIGDRGWVKEAAGYLLLDPGPRHGVMWNTAATLYDIRYDEYDQFNYQIVDLNTGPWWQDRRWSLRFPAGATERQYGEERLSRTIYAEPSWLYAVSPGLRTTVTYTVRSERYYADRYRGLDNEHHGPAASARFFLLDRRLALTATAGYEFHNAESDRFTYDDPYLAASFTAVLPWGTQLQASYSWNPREYHEAPVFFDQKRKDSRHIVGASLTHPFGNHLFVTAWVSHTHNDSNTPLYEFSRTISAAMIGFRF